MSKFWHLSAGKMKVFSLGLLVFSVLAVNAYADTVDSGTAAPFAVLGEAGVTNTGPSVIYGSVAGSAGTPAVTGFPPGGVVAPGVLYLAGVANSGAGTPFGDALAAYTYATSLGAFNEGTASLGAGGLTSLAPGVYSFTSSTVLLSGLLQLNAGTDNNASWTFVIPFALTTDSASSVEVVNAGGNGTFGGSITWAVGSDATLGTTTTFLGTIISKAGDQLLTGATIGCGRVISLDASVTLDDNVISTPPCTATGGTGTSVGSGGTGGTGGTITPPTPTPEPATLSFLGFGLAGLVGMARKTRAKVRTRSA
jgi:hypothetical protein